MSELSLLIISYKEIYQLTKQKANMFLRVPL